MNRALRIIAHPNFILFNIAVACLCFVGGCAGTFLSEAPTVIQIVLGSLSSILAVVGIIVPGSTVITGAINAAVAELQEIEALVEEYKTTPDETLLNKIEAGIQLAITNIQPLLAPIGIPAAAATKIGAIAQLILSQLEAWAAIFPASAPSPAVTAEAHAAVSKVTVSKPLPPAALRAELNSLFAQQTGDTATDAAFATVPKL